MITNQLAGFAIKGVSILLGFLISIALARTVGSEGLGLINLSWTILGIVATLCIFGANIYIARYVAQTNDSEQTRREIANCLVISLLLSTVFAISVYLFLADHLEQFFATEGLAAVLSILIITLIPRSIRDILGNAVRGNDRALLANVYIDLTPNLLRAGGLFVVLSLIGTITIIQYAYILVAAAFVSALPPAYWLWRRLQLTPVPTPTRQTLAATMRESSTFLWISSTFIVANAVDMLMIGYFSDVNQVAYYSVALSISSLFTLILGVSNSVISPRAAKTCELGDYRRVRQLYRGSRNFMVAIATAPMLLVWFFSTDLLQIWGSEFTSATLALLILSLTRYLELLTGNAGLMLTMLKRERIVKNSLIASVIANILLNALLIPSFGITGAALATGATLLANRLVLVYFFRQIIEAVSDT